MEEVSKLTYREATDELNESLSYMEQSDVDIDELVPKLERATAIIAEMDKRIKASKVRVEEIVPKLNTLAAGESEFDEEPFDSDEEPPTDEDLFRMPGPLEYIEQDEGPPSEFDEEPFEFNGQLIEQDDEPF